MKFVKGMLIGGIVTAGVAMMYSEAMGDNKRKMMKKGKKIMTAIISIVLVIVLAVDSWGEKSDNFVTIKEN